MTSLIWDYFDRNESAATCSICGTSISLGSAVKSKQTHVGLVRHLEKRHSKQHALFLSTKKEESKRKQMCVNNASLTRQLKLDEINYAGSSDKWPNDHAKSLEIDKSILKMIVLDYQPFSIVEDQSFQNLIAVTPSLFNSQNA